MTTVGATTSWSSGRNASASRCVPPMTSNDTMGQPSARNVEFTMDSLTCAAAIGGCRPTVRHRACRRPRQLLELLVQFLHYTCEGPRAYSRHREVRTGVSGVAG